MKRYDVERAALRAQMPAPAKALVLALCTRISARSGAIEARYSPSLAALARMTGYHKATVCRYLGWLEREGWLGRERPDPADAGRHHLTTVYSLWIPGAGPVAPCDAAPSPAETAPRRTGRHGPVALADAAPSPAATQSERAQRPDRERTQIVVSDDDLAGIAQAELAALTGRRVTRAVAAEAARLVLAGRDVARPAAYLRRALRADPARFLPAPSGPVPYADLARHMAEAIARSEGMQE